MTVASGLRDQKDFAGAQSVLLQLVPIAEAKLGQEHVVVVTAKMGLSLNAFDLGQLEEAARWREQLLSTRDKSLGNEHASTTSEAWNLFLIRWLQGQDQACDEIFRERFLWFCKKMSRSLTPNSETSSS